MSSQEQKVIPWRMVALLEAVALASLLGGLATQSMRQRWPFAPPLPPAGVSAHAGHDVSAQEGHAEHMEVGNRVPVTVDPGRWQAIGLKLTSATVRRIDARVRVVATLAVDESRVAHVHARVSGWIDRLYINTTGQPVRAGQPLASIYSQDLLSSQSEFLTLRQNQAPVGDKNPLLAAARTRLRLFGMTDPEIATLEHRGQVLRNVTLLSPRDGVVLHRGITAGMAVDPSTELLTVADLSQVWAFAEVPEAQVGAVRVGAKTRLSFPNSAKPAIDSSIEFLYPTLSERTRTLRARMIVANPDGSLRPGLFGTAEIETTPREALVIPLDAVVDTGATQHVFVHAGEAGFVPRPVSVGARLDDLVEIKEGLVAGEQVVGAGVFLIDSESRLRASSGSEDSGASTGTHQGHGGH